jgi:uncharacterized protein (TIGR03118 family)
MVRKLCIGIWLTCSIGAIAACSSDNDDQGIARTAFVQTDLLSDTPTLAPLTDPALVNSWGIVRGQAGFWIADNGTGALTIVDGNGRTLPGSDQIVLEPGITGIVANTSFVAGTATPNFLVASESGRIFGVTVSTTTPTSTVLVDRSSVGAIYKGITIVDLGGRALVLAADFHNGNVDVFDSTLTQINNMTMFVDPNLPAGFAPFNVAALGGVVYVAYAQQGPGATDEVIGPGLGIVDGFNNDGTFGARLTTDGALNAPWGMVLAPSTFGEAANTLLVGNFGDGRITELDPSRGTMFGQLTGTDGLPIAIDGLWGLEFGNSNGVGNANSLYFAAGPNNEANGLYGRIDLAP